MVNKVLLTARIAAGESDSVDCGIGQSVIHLICADLGSGEVADIQIYSDLVSGNWVDFYHDGSKQTLTQTQTGRTITDYGRYRVQKPDTVGLIGVEANFGLI